MTATRDPDRLLRAWLDLMPDEAPDRAIAAVLQATETTPQAGSLVPAFRRFSMSRLSMAIAAAAVVVVLGGVILLIRPSNPIGPSLAPTNAPPPTAAQPSVALAGPVSAELQDDWLGAPRAVTGLAAFAGTHLRISADVVEITQSNTQTTPFLRAGAASDAGTLRLEGQATTLPNQCPADSSGTYRVALSPSGQTLTLTLVADTCEARGLAIAGAWWRADCLESSCLGLIDPGTYGTEYFLPRMRARADWRPEFGALGFTTTIPWAQAADWPAHAILMSPEQFAKWTPDGGPEDPSDILVLAKPAAILDAAACHDPAEVDPAVGQTVDALMAYVTSQPGIDATEVSDFSIDGYDGKMVDIQLASSFVGGCPGSPAGENLLISSLGREFGDDWGVGLSGTHKTRLMLISLGRSDVVGIAVESTATDLEATLNAALPIIHSFTFK
jgi:hypothetical protein